MRHVRPWEILQRLGDDRDVHLTIPQHRGTESLTIMSIETILLIAAARIVKAKTVLELGTSMGYTALHLALNLYAHIYTVDLENKNHAFSSEDPRITFLQQDISTMSPFPCDMVFCDSNYSPELISRCTDLAFACAPRVIAWHDYGNEKDAPWQKGVLDKLSDTVDLFHVEDTWLVFWFQS